MRYRHHLAPVPRSPEPAPLPAHAHAGLSNHGLARLLARKTMDAAEWEKAATGSGGVAPLYADVATEIGSMGLRDIEGTDVAHITGALTPADVKPGLNFVSRGIGKGRTYYIEDGKPVNKLAVTKAGPLPGIAVCLAKTVFIPGNRAFALATLRHEIEHARHTQRAIDHLQKWRDRGAKGDFRVWLGQQGLAQADRELIGERVDGSTVNTEVLSHLAGFIMAFPQEDHEKANPQRSVYDQLSGVAEHWGSATTAVKQEAVRRITEMKKAQKGPALTALKAAFTRLKGEPDSPKELVDAVLSARG
jgi:hypothetical protein